MKLLVLPYNKASESAKALVNSLRPLALLKKQNTPVKGRDKVIVNWGSSHFNFKLPGVIKAILNAPQCVVVASNKFQALSIMKREGVNVPDFTKDIEVAKGWLGKRRIVFCRKLLRASSGKGIVIAKTVDQLVSAPLYVKYIRKEHEYRVHVFKDKVIDVVEKKRRKGFKEATDYNRYVRSYEQGWVFTRKDIQVPEAVKEESIKACRALGLDFGAVDVILDYKNNPVVLEVNTAPGLQGTTLNKYKEALKEYLNEIAG